jgi:hypothetical protein
MSDNGCGPHLDAVGSVVCGEPGGPDAALGSNGPKVTLGGQIDCSARVTCCYLASWMAFVTLGTVSLGLTL